jgi:hypothetical protein
MLYICYAGGKEHVILLCEISLTFFLKHFPDSVISNDVPVIFSIDAIPLIIYVFDLI